METQELNMLNFLNKIEQEEICTSNFFEQIIEEFDSINLAEIWIMKLYNKNYTYCYIKDNQFVLGNTKIILTDKGKKFLKSNKIYRWFIENGSSTLTIGNIIALVFYILTTIINIF